MPTYTDLKKKGTNEIVYPNIQTQNIPNSAVSASKIATGAVTDSKIASNAVTADKIATSAVTETKIDSNAVTSAKIADSAVTTTKIANGAITTTKIENGSVTYAKLANGAIPTEKLNISRFSLGVAISSDTTYQEVEDDIVNRITTSLKLGGGLLGFAIHTSNSFKPAFLFVDTTNKVISINVLNADGTFTNKTITNASDATEIQSFITFATPIRVDLINEV